VLNVAAANVQLLEHRDVLFVRRNHQFGVFPPRRQLLALARDLENLGQIAVAARADRDQREGDRLRVAGHTIVASLQQMSADLDIRRDTEFVRYFLLGHVVVRLSDHDGSDQQNTEYQRE
jgi:hypothetical protein